MMTRPPSIRLATLLIAVIAAVASCSDAAQDVTTTSEPPATTTTTVDQIQAEFATDVDLIQELWRGESLAFASGFEDGLSFWADNNYPPMGCEYEQYLQSRFPDGPVEGLTVERVVDELTIVRDDGWSIPGGALAGHSVDGRIYVMSIEATTTSPQELPDPPTTRDLHVTILDGNAHFFLECSSL